jgi:hypothetical protein
MGSAFALRLNRDSDQLPRQRGNLTGGAGLTLVPGVRLCALVP